MKYLLSLLLFTGTAYGESGGPHYGYSHNIAIYPCYDSKLPDVKFLPGKQVWIAMNALMGGVWIHKATIKHVTVRGKDDYFYETVDYRTAGKDEVYATKEEALSAVRRLVEEQDQ